MLKYSKITVWLPYTSQNVPAMLPLTQFEHALPNLDNFRVKYISDFDITGCNNVQNIQKDKVHFRKVQHIFRSCHDRLLLHW